MVRKILGLFISALPVAVMLCVTSHAYAEDRETFCARHGAILGMSAKYNKTPYELETFLKVLDAQSSDKVNGVDSQYVAPYIKTAYVTGDVETVLDIFLKDCMSDK